jgi:crotonobetainyl-CoA:carnitine CoA-transferase CaiB-like acyl-CoA transferase
LEHPEFGSYEYEAPPFRLSETPAKLQRPSPLLGQHNDYVFGDIVGLSRIDIQKLKDEGIIA